jgi:hypothetical protein
VGECARGDATRDSVAERRVPMLAPRRASRVGSGLRAAAFGPLSARFPSGEMSEWLKEHDWKSCRR